MSLRLAAIAVDTVPDQEPRRALLFALGEYVSCKVAIAAAEARFSAALDEYDRARAALAAWDPYDAAMGGNPEPPFNDAMIAALEARVSRAAAEVARVKKLLADWDAAR